MPAEAVAIPLWGKLVLLSLGKKAVVLTAGYLYGFPRLYRRVQKAARYLTRDKPASRRQIEGIVRSGFRLPTRFLHLYPRQPASPALQYLSQLPSRLQPARPAPALALKPAASGSKASAYSRLRTSFASSGLAQRQAQNLAAGRAKLTSLRDRFAGSAVLQAMVVGRAQRAAEMWRKSKQQPYSFVQAVH